MPTTSRPVNLPTVSLPNPIKIAGIVERGDRRGRLLGFPTANLAIAESELPVPQGVYAGLVHCGGTSHVSAISLGRRPTFYEDRGLLLLEAHLIDYCGDLYDELIEVEIIGHLRAQIRFGDVDALRDQLARDVDHARQVMRNMR